jgi:hypothetical protein
MDNPNVEKALSHLKAAIALLEEGSTPRPGRNAEWFRETGHLSDKGIEYLNAQFAKGRTSYSIAQEMKLSYRAVALRHDQWRKRNPSPAAWMRQDGRSTP